MEATPRSWQLSLSNWPVTRKVGIVLVLPVLLASTFAVLRINSELQTINNLSAGTEQAAVMGPSIKFESATEELAVQTILGLGNPDANVIVDKATATFDQSVADLETLLRSSRVEASVVQGMTDAIGVAKNMRNGLHTSSPQSIADQSGAVSTKVQAALTTSQTLSDLRVQQLFLQQGTVMTAARLLTQERLMLATPGIGANEAMKTQLLTAMGAEITMIEVYKGLVPEAAQNYSGLKDAAGMRIGILSQGAPDPMAIPAMAESIKTSQDLYSREANGIGAMLDDKLGELTTDARNTVLRDTSVVIGMLLAGLALALIVARSLVVPVRRLRRDALQVAHIDLPQELEVVRAGGVTPEITPVDVHTTEEIGQLARAVDDIHTQALHLAAEQARLRLQIGNMFETLSRRSQSLVEQQLTLIEELERDEDDSERLQSLFRLDHLATRMRRNGDNLLVLAGTALRRGHLAPVPLSDMLWSSVSQVEDYQRAEIGTVPDGIVAGEPAVDIEHLLAELIDNALRYSPPSTPVAVSVARAVDGGYLIEITDRGLGMNAEDLQSINDRLASGGEVNVETARRMGLFVVGRLAKRHNITVSLRRTSAMVQQPGITASVHLPGTLVSPAPERGGDTGTGQYPATAALPVAPAAVAPVSSLPTSAPQPLVTPPRLMPVPNPPEVVTTGRFGVTSSGLPQRKTPGTDTGEQPVFTGDVPFTDNFVDAFADGGAPTQAYEVVGPNAQPPVDFWGDTGQHEVQRPQEVQRPAPADGGYGYGSENGADDTGSYFSNGYSAFGTGAGNDAGNGLSGDDHRGNGNGNGSNGNGFGAGGNGRTENGNGYGGDTGNGFGSDSGSVAAPALPQRGQAPQAPAPQVQTPQPTAPAPAQRDNVMSGSPIYQRMVSEWLVEPAGGGQDSSAEWSSTSDAGWAAAEEAATPTSDSRTQGGLPIRRPGAQLVPGAVAQEDEAGARNPDEIRNSLTRHLSGVRSGRADSQYTDGGHV
ncbi:sensor histidine kinase [Nocardia sp. NBC_01503]|uniref:HAMP domain-containing sensor histidine kinase n=1 Tax=Nocardia sp. NBC_01503 TaxID=2975997 RepID=UPI002E7BEAF9|nr:sensor histidine kinase [Nocardia sp. NBC_01503]WTL35487.1 sensor histidine kinase [Nocardia sp. NBC_01503]